MISLFAQGGWAHRQEVSTAFWLGKTRKFFLCSRRGSNLWSLDLGVDALPIEPPRHLIQLIYNYVCHVGAYIILIYNWSKELTNFRFAYSWQPQKFPLHCRCGAKNSMSPCNCDWHWFSKLAYVARLSQRFLKGFFKVLRRDGRSQFFSVILPIRDREVSVDRTELQIYIFCIFIIIHINLFFASVAAFTYSYTWHLYLVLVLPVFVMQWWPTF